MMKQHIMLLLLLPLLCWACQEDYTVDPTLMPEATQSGENTLGCLVEGWVYTSQRFGYPEQNTYEDEEGNRCISIHASVGRFTSLEFTLVNPVEGAVCSYTDVRFDGRELEDGEAYITRLDDKVLSGTFSGGRISEGRFDLMK